MPPIETFVIINMLDVFDCYLMVLHHYKINCFEKSKPSFLTLLFFVLFCLNVSEPYYGVVHFFLLKYKLFCLVSLLSDAILTVIINLKNGHKV